MANEHDPIAEAAQRVANFRRAEKPAHAPKVVATYTEHPAPSHTASYAPAAPSDKIIGLSNKYSPEAEDLQNMLKAKGFLKGKVDGYFGNQTLGALHAYQDANGLPRSDTFNMANLSPKTATQNDIAALANAGQTVVLNNGHADMAQGIAQWLGKPGLPGTNLQVAMAPSASSPRYAVADHPPAAPLPPPSTPNPKAAASLTIRSNDDGGRGSGA